MLPVNKSADAALLIELQQKRNRTNLEHLYWTLIKHDHLTTSAP